MRRGRVDLSDPDILHERRLKLQRRTLHELREQAEMLDESNDWPSVEIAEAAQPAAGLASAESDD